MIKRWIAFFKNDLWKIDIESFPKSRFLLFQQLRIFVLAIRGFNEDNLLLRASGLTFYTLISIVPVIAMAFGIAKGFGFEQVLNEQIEGYFENQPEVSALLIDFSHSFLDNTKGGLIAGFGLFVLFWSVLKVLGNIELSFNAIWGISKARNWIRKFTEYLSIMLLAPVFIVISGSITVYIASLSNDIENSDSLFNTISPFFKFLIELSPYVVIWFLFTFIYIAIPNTKVNFKNAFIAGIVGGTLFQVLEWAYFSFQIGAVKYNAIYGSFAAFPLFLVWLQSSWMIVLFGCEIAFANQNVKQYIFENEVNNISIKHKKKITLLMIILINKNFNEGAAAHTVNSICSTLKLPVRLVQNIIDELLLTGLIIEAYTDKIKLIGYSPAKDLNHLKASELIKIIEEKGSNDIPMKNTAEWEWVDATVEDFIQNNQSSKLDKHLTEVYKNLKN